MGLSWTLACPAIASWQDIAAASRADT